jgi:hypothetical protein
MIDPMNYKTGWTGIEFGLLFGLFAGGWAFIGGVVANGGIALALPFIILSAVFILGGVLMDITHNAKAKKNSARKAYMLTQPCVPGKIVCVKKYIDTLGRHSEVPNDVHYKASNLAFRFTVRFTDPSTGAERETTTEDYSFHALNQKLKGQLRLGICYDPENANVYCAPDGSVWVGILYKDPNE